MDIAELEKLGITKDQIIDRIIDRAADRLLVTHCTGADEDGRACAWDDNSPLAIELKKVFKARVDTALADVVDRHILPNVARYIENVTLQATNKWGEKKGESLTFLEYLTQRAEAYLIEEVDFQGKSRDQDSYNWKGTQTRITHMVHKHLHFSIEQAMETALKTANSAIVGGIEQAVKIKLAEVSEKLKMSVNP